MLLYDALGRVAPAQAAQAQGAQRLERHVGNVDIEQPWGLPHQMVPLHLLHDLARLAYGQALLAEQHAVQRFAVHVLHDHEHPDLLVLAEVDDGGDARVAHGRGEARLAIEQLARLVGLRDLVRDDLQRERAGQVRVGDLVDLAHAALPDALDDLVAAADQRAVLGRVHALLGAARGRHRGLGQRAAGDHVLGHRLLRCRRTGRARQARVGRLHGQRAGSGERVAIGGERAGIDPDLARLVVERDLGEPR